MANLAFIIRTHRELLAASPLQSHLARSGVLVSKPLADLLIASNEHINYTPPHQTAIFARALQRPPNGRRRFALCSGSPWCCRRVP